MPLPINFRPSCPCCDQKPTAWTWGVASAFLARRAFGRDPFLTQVFKCADCGCAWSGEGLGEEAAAKLYAGYRGEAYFKQRHGFEPWCSKRKNDSIGSEEEMIRRRAVLAQALQSAELAGGPRPGGACVDYGGDRGQMLRDLAASSKWVHDLSGVEPEPWAKKAPQLGALRESCALALNCQVLEHVDDPLGCLRETASLVAPGGWVYVEVPQEPWRQQGGLGEARHARWLAWLAARPALFKMVDFISTACRLALGWVPFFGFWAMREHLNFFEPASVEALARRAGLEPLWIGLTPSGVAAVLVKSSPEAL